MQPSHSQQNYTAPPSSNDGDQPATNQHQDYNFIMSPGAPVAGKLPRGSRSSLLRVFLIVGGLFLLLIIFIGLKNILSSSGSDGTAIVGVAQEQQELIHLATTASAQTGISTTTQNSTATIQLSVTSSQGQLLAYAKSNGLKISKAQLNLKVSSSTDAQLAAAATAGNYDQTYASVMTAALTTYQQALKTAYAQVKGPKGRAILNSDYNGAKLLVVQLNPAQD